MVGPSLFTIAALAATPANAAAGPPASPGMCALLLPPADIAAMAPRPPTAEDLVRLRDIGPPDVAPPGARLLAVSPDGTRVAFQLARADPDANGHCLAMLVQDLRGGPPRVVDQGGARIQVRYDFRGKAAFPTGIAAVITPHWSPDGRWIAFLKRTDGTVQVWRAFADGSGSAPLTRSPVDVEDFRIAPDGRGIVYASRPALAAAYAAIAREGRSGFHYDERYAPTAGSRPFPAAPVPTETQVVDIATGAVRPARQAEAGLLGAPDDPDGARDPVRAPHGAQAWIDPASRPVVEDATGRRLVCTAPACRDAERPWWVAGERLRFLRREGWARGATAIYEWTPGAGPPRRLHLTRDKLADCVPADTRLLCLREGALVPRRLEWLDPASGRRDILFDPNPEFARLRLGQVERLEWTNASGLETIGDLVLPAGYRPGRRYPLIVVQYDTRGFLRGGTGDEYPIQAFAARGYAVLSVSRPESIGEREGHDEIAIGRANLAGFADRRSALSSVETGVRMLIARGIADPEQIGITGMSDGATTATFALLHGSLFAAAAMSNCCLDTTLPLRVGPAAARYFHAVGYPRLTDDGAAFWAALSLSRNARRIATPILLQVSDDEFLSTLESYTALREVGAPIDMYVFPDEHHVKWQPAHRLAVYRRALDWFDYWLRGLRPASPAHQAELRHWDRLRQENDRRTQAQEARSRDSQ
ncbi:Atxe2 family lasso peptide isopeptidase [Sphingosinicella sp. LHD-64]|uniref:Atxe2 family lasso peptide isopeptidase n=1 Tax=Sphingosinicella sp. LHD-64 TaxID=3072139 RepID=UPI00280D6F01|nr:Atxe2 family lasso peptide isopeptidase [Sphingosinicella sp. LHD-64]MDQ8757407.1 Atxe2 family lasso peptide isopeptidase [Sphingosinicella sp. LHD-64]